MKDLIAVFAHCPDSKRKRVLDNLIEQIQPLRENFDILIVSHSDIPTTSLDGVDYFYYDKNNDLITDFDLGNNFWFRTNSFKLNSTIVYPFSTHLAIYNLLYYTLNFAKFKGHKKIHCIEYDINLSSLDLIEKVNNNLDEFDTVMFRREDAWIYGTYFAFTLNKFPEDYFIYNKNKILDELRNSETRMTEHITPKILTVNDRTVIYEPLSVLDPQGIFQKVDMHKNDELNWCVPLCDKFSDELHFFVYNDKGGEYKIDVIVENKHFQFINNRVGTWSILPIGDLNNVNKIIIIVNDVIKKEVCIPQENKEKFKKHNFVEFL